MSPLLPTEFADLEPFAAKWCLATEHERYEVRLATSMDEMHTFYDAAFPRMEAAMAVLLLSVPPLVKNMLPGRTPSSFATDLRAVSIARRVSLP